jgi:hypothetical protein
MNPCNCHVAGILFFLYSLPKDLQLPPAVGRFPLWTSESLAELTNVMLD